MRLSRLRLVGFFVLIFVPLTFFVRRLPSASSFWQQEALPTLAPTAVLPTLTASSTAPATATATATATPAPTETAAPTLSPTDTPTATPAPTDPPLPTPTFTPAPETMLGAACPDPPPLKPAYGRYVVGSEPWPTPNPALAVPHFWLSKPLPGGGRVLINQGFPYGYDANGRYLLHNGVDMAEPQGTPLLAVADGTVVVARGDQTEWFGWRCDWYGQLVVLELDETYQGQPLYALYGHVLNITVTEGQRVQRGEMVAEVGFGGAASVPHLHFELRVGGNQFTTTVNPMLWLHPGETRGVIAGRLLDPEGKPWRGVGLSLIGHSADASSGNTWSYLDDPLHYINPDPGYAENFLFADVKPGSYDVYTKIQGVEYRAPVEVIAGQVSVVEIVTEPYRAATATPAP